MTDTGCFDYFTPGGNVLTTSGVYVETIPNQAGCDSIITINLTIIERTSSAQLVIDQRIHGLQAKDSSEAFQWVDCTTDNAVLQDLNYTFDPGGNITELRDNAHETVYFKNAVVEPHAAYTYDALYRLKSCTGREHAGSSTQGAGGPADMPVNAAFPHDNNATALRRYTQQFSYDALGNILQLIHTATGGGFTRNYTYGSSNNQLQSTTQGSATINYTHDVHGNMTAMPHLNDMFWDLADQLREVNVDDTKRAYYIYSGGERVRKVVVNGITLEDRIYLGSNERYRKYVSGDLETERETLHISDDNGRICMVDTLTEDNSSTPVSTPQTTQRWQYSNHLGTASLEVDENAALISYEEYHPFGTSAYRSGRSAAETSLKRYRYVGKERDDESGLYYYGARYYAAWLCRFVSVDPLKDKFPQLNPYNYAGNKPVNGLDLDGLQSTVDEPKEDVFVPKGAPNNPEEGTEHTVTDGDLNWHYAFLNGKWEGMGTSGTAQLSEATIVGEDTRPWWKKAAHWVRDHKEGVLDGLQTALDVAGLIPVVGNIADLVNVGISAARGDWTGVALGLAAAIPGAGLVAGGAKIGRTAVKYGGKAVKALKKGKGTADEVAELGEAVVKKADEAAEAAPSPSTPNKVAEPVPEKVEVENSSNGSSNGGNNGGSSGGDGPGSGGGNGGGGTPGSGAIRQFPALKTRPNKLQQHAHDWGLTANKGDAVTKAQLDEMGDIALGIKQNAIEVKQGVWGNPAHGGFNDAVFFFDGANVIVTKPDGTLITILKNAMNNRHLGNATTIWTKGGGFK